LAASNTSDTASWSEYDCRIEDGAMCDPVEVAILGRTFSTVEREALICLLSEFEPTRNILH